MSVGALSGNLKVEDNNDDALSIADSGFGTSSVVTTAALVSRSNDGCIAKTSCCVVWMVRLRF